MITAGCAVHCLDLLSEGIFKIPEIDAVVGSGTDIIVCVKNHKYLARTFKKVRATLKTRGMKIFHDTRFSHAHLPIESFGDNQRTFNDLQFDEEWNNSVKMLSVSTRAKMGDWLSDVALW